MTKAELIAKLAEKAELDSKSKAEKVLGAIVEILNGSLAAGDTVTLNGFGTFKTVERAERKCRNPRTKQEMVVPACKVAKFTPAKQLKEAIQ